MNITKQRASVDSIQSKLDLAISRSSLELLNLSSFPIIRQEIHSYTSSLSDIDVDLMLNDKQVAHSSIETANALIKAKCNRIKALESAIVIQEEKNDITLDIYKAKLATRSGFMNKLNNVSLASQMYLKQREALSPMKNEANALALEIETYKKLISFSQGAQRRNKFTA